jgi:hypothetical protein
MSTNQEEDYAQLRDRLTELEAKFQHFSQLFTLPERVTKIEDTLLLVADVHRFKRLQELLAAADWQQADLETIQVILSVTKAPDLESISPNDVRQFPCNELYVIDRLWTNYSQGRFGFSVQAQLYQSVGGSLETTIAQDYSVIERFGDRAGWRVNGNWQKCDDLDYTLNAPIGCHPSRWWNSPFGAKMTNYFFARLMTCEL